ncbi:MAG TPA: hypothetical protein VGG39_34450 [Polyangiaceae bacterium]
MAIDYGYNPRRRTVAWVHAAPDAQGRAAFEARGFAVPAFAWGPNELNDDAEISGAAALVFTQTRTRPTEIAAQLATYGKRLLDFDCNVLVLHLPGGAGPIANVANAHQLPIARLPANEVPEVAEEIRRWQRTTGDLPRPHLRLYVQGLAWNEIANYEMVHPAGPAPDPDVQVEASRGKAVDTTVRLLTRRAFHGCSEVHLRPMAGGHSGAKVFLAHVEFRGRWSLPYFVKTGERNQIIDEYKRYEEHVDPYVPFHLGPRLDLARCGLGADKGILVGDFVDESECLLDCAREGRASTAIACLFERTLRGWYRGGQPRDGRLGRLVRQFQPRIAPARWQRARELGATKTPYELRGILRAGGTSTILWGAMHGDLHASNVRVRGSEAILIDFLQCGAGPLLGDAAALEASLLVGALHPASSYRTEGARLEYDAQLTACRASLDPLYGATSIDALPAHVRPSDEWSWFHACVRQIRMHAFHMQRARGQYALALAAALIYKAGKDQRAREPESSSRALAYVYGERLLVAAASLFPSPVPPATPAPHPIARQAAR